MAPSRPGWSTDPMSPTGISHQDLQGDQLQQRQQEPDPRMHQANPPLPQGQRIPESPYPYYTPREGEVVWPPASNDPSQQPYMGPGPSRIPYDPGAFAYGQEGQPSSSSQPPQQQQQQSQQYPSAYPPPLDRAFDSGNYHGMTSPPSTQPSTSIMTPAFQYSNPSQQHMRSNDPYQFSNAGSSNLNPNNQQSSSRQQSQSQSIAGYPYNPSDTIPPPQEQPSRRQSKRLNEGSGEWPGPEYGQMGVQPGPSYRPFMPPNIDPAFYPPPFSAGQPNRGSPERQQTMHNSTSPHRSVSTNSPQDAGRRRSGNDIIEDEEEWSHLPESERAMAKLDKRRGQNKIAQRAFRARTRMNKAQTSTDLAHLTELTQSQAKRLDDMTILVATLQRENAELRMAAMRASQPPASSAPESASKPNIQSNDLATSKDEAQNVQDESMDQEQDHPTPSKNKRPARSRNSS